MSKSSNIEKVSGYELTRAWFDYAFENQDKLCPSHTAMFLWFVELNNRMGWANNFSSPASQTMAAIGLKSYNSYKRIFDELAKIGFIKVISESKNQWTSCVIALSNNDKAKYKALDKALTKQTPKQSESTGESIDSIIKPLNQETFKPINKEVKENFPPIEIDFVLTKKVMDWFGFSEVANFDKFRQVVDFQKCLSTQNKIEYFEDQFGAYSEYKTLDPKFKHNFKNFLGDQKELFENGAWNSENWILRLKAEKEKSCGKKEKPGKAEAVTNAQTQLADYWEQQAQNN